MMFSQDATGHAVDPRNGEHEPIHRPHGPIPDRARRPSMIPLDLDRPGTDGREVLGKLEANEGARRTPVAVPPPLPIPRDVDACYRPGADGDIIKPVDSDRFLRSIRSFRECRSDAPTLTEENG